jgi:hypothetical protein
VEHKPV